MAASRKCSRLREKSMRRLEAGIALGSDPECRQESLNRLQVPRTAQTPPHGNVGAYVIALSQTDTVEQARWMRAMETRTQGVDRRSLEVSPMEDGHAAWFDAADD